MALVNVSTTLTFLIINFLPMWAAEPNLYEILSRSNANMESMNAAFSEDKITELDILENQQSSDRSKRAALKEKEFYWTDNIVRFWIDGSVFDAASEIIIRDSMQVWSHHTCLRFQEDNTNPNYVFITSMGDFCLSNVGSLGTSLRNIILLGPWCRSEKHVVLHEIGHTLGHTHEHTRPDRDDYVEILNENIIDWGLSNFKKRPSKEVNSRDVEYDFRSIMHYEKDAWAKYVGNTTIRTLDPSYQDIIGTARELSFRDIKVVNLMYECDSACTAEEKAKDCPGEGFVGRDCRCWCPGQNSIVQMCDACSIPPTPEHGSKQGSVHTVGSSVSFACDPGYKLVGAAAITCVGFGEWDAAAPTCQECGDSNALCRWWKALCWDEVVRSTCKATCNLCTPGPKCQYPVLENGALLNNSLDVNSVMNFECNSGYIMDGIATSTCNSINGNMEWVPPVPKCQVTCSDPGVPSNGMKHGDNYRSGSTVSFTCNVGYTLEGVSSIVCGTNGQWSALRPACIPVACPSLKAPSGGRMNTTSYTYGSIVTFECDVGYEITGPSALVCQSDGDWNSSEPTCTVVNDVEFSCNFDNYSFCGIVVFSRWRLDVSSQVTSQYAYFNQNNQFMRAIMKTPGFNEADQHQYCLKFRILIEDYLQGSFAIYDQHFRQLWYSKNVITSSVWQIVRIGIPPTVTTLYLVAINYHSTVGHIGLDNLELIRGSCTEGGVCSDPGIPQYGSVTNERLASYTAGSVINFYCHVGFYALTPLRIRCLPNGGWEGAVTSCASTQSAPANSSLHTEEEDIVCDNDGLCQQMSQQGVVDYLELYPNSSCCLKPLVPEPEPDTENEAEPPMSDHCVKCLSFCQLTPLLGNCNLVCGCNSSDTETVSSVDSTVESTTVTTTTNKISTAGEEPTIATTTTVDNESEQNQTATASFNP